MLDIDAVITGALIFSGVMGILIYIGRKPRPPKRPKIIMPKLKGRHDKGPLP